jgi:hypothetical protein
LSDVLETIHLHDAEAVQSSFTAPWEIRISAGTAGFYYVSQGKYRLHLDGSESAAVLCSGDLALVMKEGIAFAIIPTAARPRPHIPAHLRSIRNGKIRPALQRERGPL